MPVIITGNNTPTAGGITYGDGSTYANTAAGTAGQLLQSNGASAPVWATISTSPTIVRSARTSNTILGTADVSTLIAITSGTFTQTFTAAATLGSGWFCYIQNSGTGDITLDPNGSETIDGLTSYIMYPNECRLVQCTGTAFNTIVLNSFYRTFTASGTFTKPPGYSNFSGLLWGAGGGGGFSQYTGASQYVAGGGGGACNPFTIPASLITSPQTVTLGAGGAAAGNVDTAAGVGGTSTFVSISAYGGGGGYGYNGGVNVCGGSGGGAFGAGSGPGTGSAGGPSSVVGGQPRTAVTGTNAYAGAYGGGSTTSSSGGSTAYFGGAGSAGTATSSVTGSTVYGGGGGGGFMAGATLVPPVPTTYGGAGGAAVINGAGNAGTAPGGGGGGGSVVSAGDGARGEFRIWGIV